MRMQTKLLAGLQKTKAPEIRNSANSIAMVLQRGAVAHLSVVTKNLVSMLTTNARQFVATKGDSGIKDIVAVDPDGA